MDSYTLTAEDAATANARPIRSHGGVSEGDTFPAVVAFTKPVRRSFVDPYTGDTVTEHTGYLDHLHVFLPDHIIQVTRERAKEKPPEPDKTEPDKTPADEPVKETTE